MAELNNGEHGRKELGQALTEYALILVLLAIALGTALALTGPAIGNVFCNVVHNLGGDTASPQGGECGSTAPDLELTYGGGPTGFWKTVTWVAQHPQHETPFPTPIRRPPINSGAGVQPTNTPSNTPTNTQTFTPTNTYTVTNTYTPGPSPTNGDIPFSVPYADQINNPEWWRLDTGDFMGYNAWSGTMYSTVTVSGSPWYTFVYGGATSATMTGLGTDINGINLSWTSSTPPIGSTANWGAKLTRTIQVGVTGIYKLSLDAADFANVTISGVNGNNPIVYLKTGGTSVAQIQIPKGTYNLTLDYGTNSTVGHLKFTVDRLSVNPDDAIPASSLNSCTWGRSGDANNPVSVTWMFDENPGGDTWTSGQTCYLELRGYIDMTGKDYPSFSFWDIWDFKLATGVTAKLQMSVYEKDTNGFLDRSKLVWQDLASHTDGERNYNWTRHQIDLTTAQLNSIAVHDPVSGNPILDTSSRPVRRATFRYVIGSSSPGAAPFRWYIDDIQVVDNVPPATPYFTINNSWDMNLFSEMKDFIYDGDSYDNTAVQNVILPRRWSLTTSHAHSEMAWDDSPGGNYQKIILSPGAPSGAGDARIHFLEFKYPINLTGTAPAADTQGHTGDPLLTFWHAFDIASGASIRVQYFDPGSSTWTDIPNQGVLIDYTIPAASSRTNLSMQPVSIDLLNIPAAIRANPVRIRFALYVDASAATTGDGWYIDDIAFKRESSSPYFAYPFIDDVESPGFTSASWDMIGGRWGSTSAKGGAEGTGNAYADSPGGLYAANDLQLLQLHYAIDLNHDTPANLAPTGHPTDLAAVSPVLSFWHQRYLGPGVVFSVEMWSPRTGVWQPIWTFDSNTTSPSFDTQRAWERAEIDLATAVSTAESKSWSAITGNGDSVFDDDDIKIRFNFTSGGGTPADGVYVDQIRIQNASNVSYRLWPSGDGEFTDSIEAASVNGVSLPGGWPTRWYTGGSWYSTNGNGYSHSGSPGQALTDSPGPSVGVTMNYGDNSYSVLELIPTITMTDPTVPPNPILTFWTRFQVGADDSFKVQISKKDTANTTQGYDKIGGWSDWVTQPMMVGVPAPGDQLQNTQVDTWLRGQVNLASFVGSVIRVRFVLSVPNTTTQADGVYIDDVKIGYTTRQISLPFADNAQTMVNWVGEGSWGLGPDYFLGNGTNDLGLSSWIGTYFDCEPLNSGPYDCRDARTYTSILAANADLNTPFNHANNAAIIGPENVTTGINFNWGSTGLPLNNNALPIGAYGSPGFADSFAARWRRDVDLQAGTNYTFDTISDDGVRLTIDNMCGTTITPDYAAGADPSLCTTLPLVKQPGVIIDQWTPHALKLDYATFKVTSATAITRKLTLQYFETDADAVMILNATTNYFSFTDSPNSPGATGFDIAGSIYPGNSSLMLDGYFDLSSAVAPNPRLVYQRLYDLRQNQTFYVEVSNDGGFTWTTVNTETATNSVVLPPGSNWVIKTVPLAPYAGPKVMIRFRLDTRTASLATGGVGDGVYIAGIQVFPG